jgi:alpha-beta hydrolase superfamily lysophospholipase
MRPFYFGRSEEPLFGILHPPEAGSGRREAVVVCAPFGPEYVRTHRALRELSHRLAGQGLSVLRFDYYGTGDSGGGGEEGTVEHWLEDISHALEEAKEMSGGGRLSIVGLRFGATLAALAGAGRSDIEKMVLWDPIVVGREYIAELAEDHAAHLASRPHPESYRPADPPNELLGTPLPERVRRAIEAVDLRTLGRPPASRTALISRDADPGALALCDHLRRGGAEVELEHHPGPRFWIKEDEIASALVPQATLSAITSWITR